jgi:hypothetical protein
VPIHNDVLGEVVGQNINQNDGVRRQSMVNVIHHIHNIHRIWCHVYNKEQYNAHSTIGIP